MTRKAATLEVLKKEIIRLRKLLKLSPLALLFILPLHAQAPVTENWTNTPQQFCVSTIGPPSYSCHAYDTDGTLIRFSVKIQPDGTFTNGFISKTNPSCLTNCPQEFNAVNWTGTNAGTDTEPNLSGTFSGTRPDGSTFSGQAVEVLRQDGHICAGKYGCHYYTIVESGNGSVTYSE